MEQQLTLPVVRNQLELLRMRNNCGAFGFDAAFEIAKQDEHKVLFRWEKDGKQAQLTADFSNCSFEIRAEMDDGEFVYVQE